MKKFLSAALAALMILPLCACAYQTPAQPSPTPTPQPDTEVLYEGSDLYLTYALIAVNPKAPFTDETGKKASGAGINTAGASALISWLLSDEGKKLAADYGKDKYGESVFTVSPEAPAVSSAIPSATARTKTVRLFTASALKDSGLLDALLPVFEKKYGYTVETYASGTGKVLERARQGLADAVLVQTGIQEAGFLKDEFGLKQSGAKTLAQPFVCGGYVLCGPSADPAGVKGAKNAAAAFRLIYDKRCPFISLGDGSAAHNMEATLWPETLEITTAPESVTGYAQWYDYSGAGAAAALKLAGEKSAYVLVDREDYLSFAHQN